MEEEKVVIEKCEHIWREVERDKRVAGFMQPGFLVDGRIWYEWRILQKCERCGKQHVVKY